MRKRNLLVFAALATFGFAVQLHHFQYPSLYSVRPSSFRSFPRMAMNWPWWCPWTVTVPMRALLSAS